MSRLATSLACQENSARFRVGAMLFWCLLLCRPEGAETGKPRATPGDLIRMKIRPALKGRNRILDHKPVLPFRALLFSTRDPIPRAVPWAGMSLPLRGEIQKRNFKTMLRGFAGSGPSRGASRGQDRFSVFGRRWRIASISPRSIREPRRARSARRNQVAQAVRIGQPECRRQLPKRKDMKTPGMLSRKPAGFVTVHGTVRP